MNEWMGKGGEKGGNGAFYILVEKQGLGSVSTLYEEGVSDVRFLKLDITEEARIQGFAPAL